MPGRDSHRGGGGSEFLEVLLNRAPAFQFYPDKWQSHTRRLSDQSYRVFHELLCWMWQHSPDQCSIVASADAVACAVAMPIECVRIAIAEIQNPFSPLLKEIEGRWVSNGLKKEIEKQTYRRESARTSANARWSNANASKTDAKASIPQCSPSPSSSPSSSPSDKGSDKGSDKASRKGRLKKSQWSIAIRFESALNGQWVNDAGKWIARIKSSEGKCERVVAEVENAAKENRITTTPAQYAEQIWKEFV